MWYSWAGNSRFLKLIRHSDTSDTSDILIIQHWGGRSCQWQIKLANYVHRWRTEVWCGVKREKTRKKEEECSIHFPHRNETYISERNKCSKISVTLTAMKSHLEFGVSCFIYIFTIFAKRSSKSMHIATRQLTSTSVMMQILVWWEIQFTSSIYSRKSYLLSHECEHEWLTDSQDGHLHSWDSKSHVRDSK